MTSSESPTRSLRYTAFATRHLVITVSGGVDEGAVAELRRMVRDNVTAETDVLVFDMTAVQVLTDAALDRVLDLADELAGRDVSMQVRAQGALHPRLADPGVRRHADIRLDAAG
ncbi:STAS domain-containing protein [Mangrovihabitans endophyticus]|uniref:STAS domain-containing protein n=1 Tax=Mangrovihabitans endophyticus TaxID=1751298 RepID=A0A8J3C196_9ACTN|nr:STAS domain-containing protein [Mangrovihabitans endophyticus]GGL04599.1 hypothetical protein GCM10012284_43970 [Mangrovihabitans endophyticus]